MPLLPRHYQCVRSAMNRKYPTGHVPIAVPTRDGKSFPLKRCPDPREGTGLTDVLSWGDQMLTDQYLDAMTACRKEAE